MAIHLTKSLHFRIAAGVIATVLILSTLYFVLDYRFYRNQLLAELQGSAEEVSNITLQGVLEVAMVGRHPELLQQALERMGTNTSVLRIFLIDQSGRVRFSSDPSMLGERYGLQDIGCRECHETSSSGLPQNSFYQPAGEPVLRNVRPVPNGTQCHACHQPNETNNGILVVDYPTFEMRAKLRTNFLEMMVKAGLTVGSILLVLGLLMNRLVISRIHSLVKTADQIRKGDFTARTEMSSSDEIGRLAATLDQMAAGLDRYRQEVNEKERIRISLLKRVVAAQEDERKKISRELHDQIGQSLSALLLMIQAHCRFSRLQGSLCHEMEIKIRKLIDKVHRLAWEMRPPILDDYGLESALRRFIDETSTQFGLDLDFQCISPSGLKRLPGLVEVTLYRISQEAVSNVLRHAGATHASVVLLRQQGEIKLLVEDDGCGFDLGKARQNGDLWLGLTGMKERAASCGGTFAMESEPARGTTIRVTIPLESGA